MEYQIEHHGVHHEQYWRGAGISGTSWDECCSGIGSTPAEALDDALEGACTGTAFPDEMAPAIEKEIDKLRESEEAPEEELSEGVYHYATLYWKYPEWA